MSIQKNIIPKEEIAVKTNVDRTGFVFEWNGRFLRGIYPSGIKEITELLDSGVVGELVGKGLFPETTITDLELEGCSLVVEHRKISPIINPSAWSFEMLKAAALTTIKVNLVAVKYGYTTIDAHAENVLFNNGDAIFIDLGSFLKVDNRSDKNKFGWRAFQEFYLSFYYPLVLWKKGLVGVAKSFMASSEPISWYEFFFIEHSFLRKIIPQKCAKILAFCFFSYKAINIVPNDYILENLKHTPIRRAIGKLIVFLKSKKLLFFSNVNFNSLYKKVNEITLSNKSSQWADYHDAIEITDRFKRIIELIKMYNATTILELGGNAGFLSKAIEANICNMKRIICSDYDNNAIDKLYLWKTEHPDSKIIPILLNIRNISDTAYDRYKSEAVLCLAIIHHLTITQGLSLEYIFEKIKKFSSKYVFIEFMPLGLYTEKYKCAPKPPSWYNYDWFKGGFQKYFNLVHEEALEENRILFIGELKCCLSGKGSK